MNRPRILIVKKAQFSYHTDTYKYCEYLPDDFDLTYVGFDTGKKRVLNNKVKVKYVCGHGSKIVRGLRFLKELMQEIKVGDYDIVFLVYFQCCSLLKLKFHKQRFVLDIRSSGILKQKSKRWLYNKILQCESHLFDSITVISKGLADKLKISNAHILPLGADSLCKNDKDFSELHLIYVGTFHQRNIDQTINGFGKFYRKLGNKIDLSYTIIGFGDSQTEEIITRSIAVNGLENVVEFVGRVPVDQLGKHFDKGNVGVSWIPVTDYFQYQPPTKTFEYILSGIPCVATATQANKEVINKKNGVVCGDTPESFYRALLKIYDRRKSFSSDEIRNSLAMYQWKNIVKNNLRTYLNSQCAYV